MDVMLLFLASILSKDEHINSPSVFQQQPAAHGEKPTLRALSWSLLGLSNQSEALLRPGDKALTKSSSRLEFQQNTTGVLCPTLNILPDHQVHIQVKTIVLWSKDHAISSLATISHLYQLMEKKLHFVSIWTRATIWWHVSGCTVLVQFQAIPSKYFPLNTFFLFIIVLAVEFTSLISKAFGKQGSDIR